MLRSNIGGEDSETSQAEAESGTDRGEQGSRGIQEEETGRTRTENRCKGRGQEKGRQGH